MVAIISYITLVWLLRESVYSMTDNLIQSVFPTTSELQTAQLYSAPELVLGVLSSIRPSQATLSLSFNFIGLISNV